MAGRLRSLSFAPNAAKITDCGCLQDISNKLGNCLSTNCDVVGVFCKEFWSKTLTMISISIIVMLLVVIMTMIISILFWPLTTCISCCRMGNFMKAITWPS